MRRSDDGHVAAWTLVILVLVAFVGAVALALSLIL